MPATLKPVLDRLYTTLAALATGACDARTAVAMSTEARLARLERRRRAAGEVSDQEHLRVGAAIVLARCRGDAEAALR
jgi:hypothetical protein